MINSFKDLQALLKLCRKQGITDFKMNGIEIKFGELPKDQGQYTQETEVESDDPYAGFPNRILTPEELTFYSAGGLPEDLPNKEESA